MTKETPRNPISITVFTGFLGAGKTSVILSLLPRLPKDYKVVLLKNEFGDIEVDSQLAKQSSLAAVSEILNGCMCCVLVGQMKTALLEIREKYHPDRIIIECSFVMLIPVNAGGFSDEGSAFPATLAFQIRELERETLGDLKLDAILTVIDAENFSGYEDNSPTAKMQASYTDLILINKWEHVSERALDLLIDHLNTLNDLTPKIRCEGRSGVDPALIFGLDSKLFLEKDQPDVSHHDEVETVTVSTLPMHTHIENGSPCSCGEHEHQHSHDMDHRRSVADKEYQPDKKTLPRAALAEALSRLSKESVWRVKGFVHLDDEGDFILNWAFGRYELTPLPAEHPTTSAGVRVTFMGERGGVKGAARKFAQAVHADLY